MTASEETRFREHLAELRRAAKGLEHDVTLELDAIEKSIQQFSKESRKEGKVLARDIERALLHASRRIEESVKMLPHDVAVGATLVGRTVATGATRLAEKTKGAAVEVGHVTKEATKDALARAAGVKRGHIKEWKAPPEQGS